METRARIALTICLVVCALKFAACTSVSNASRVDPSAAQLQLPDALAPSAQANAPEKLPSLPPDPAGQGRALTDYFQAHKLPLVGASVIVNQNRRQVILYGFVATAQGKLTRKKTRSASSTIPKWRYLTGSSYSRNSSRWTNRAIQAVSLEPEPCPTVSSPRSQTIKITLPRIRLSSTWPSSQGRTGRRGFLHCLCSRRYSSLDGAASK